MCTCQFRGERKIKKEKKKKSEEKKVKTIKGETKKARAALAAGHLLQQSPKY